MPRKYPRAQGTFEDNASIRRINIGLPELDFKLIAIYADIKEQSFSAYIRDIVHEHIATRSKL